MAGPLVVGAEGVVLLPKQATYGSSHPIQEGIELVLQLMHFPTTRTSVIVGTEDLGGAAHFCRVNGLAKASVVGISPEDLGGPPDEAQWFAIERLRAAGQVSLVLTAHSSVYRACRGTHQPVILFGRRGSIEQTEGRPSWNTLHQRAVSRRDALIERELAHEDQR